MERLLSTLWTFGDSFIDCTYYTNNCEYAWANQLAEKLQINHTALGMGGTALAYTYKEFDRCRTMFHSDDIILICLTSPIRKWFYEDIPYMHIAYNPDDSDSRDTKYFRLYLDNEINDFTYLENFLYNVNYASKHLKTIVLHSFFETIKITKEQKFEKQIHVN